MLSVAELLKNIQTETENSHRHVLALLDDMQCLYNDGDLYNFMNNETYDQIAIAQDTVETL